MANPLHESILNKGVNAWNNWRNINPSETADLKGIKIEDRDLSGIIFDNVLLNNSELIGINFNGSRWEDVKALDCFFNWVTFENAVLHDVSFMNSEFEFSNFDFVSGTDIGFVTASHIECTFNNFEVDSLSFEDSQFVGCKFNNIIICGSNLALGRFMDCDFTNGKLSRSDLYETIFQECDFKNVQIDNANMAQTVIDGIDLSSVIGLESIKHKNSSAIGISTLMKSNRPLPDAFLRGVGFPDAFIEYLPSLLNKTIEFYTCFISYSSKDEEFAKRLHADLQNEGIRCWFAPEDMKIGEKIRKAIHDAILIYDKLLIILSENSVGSNWVESEVEKAFEKERKQNKVVLFPVRIDSAVLDTNVAWASEIRNRHIGDFTNWKDHDKYKTFFERLLRDLKQ